MRGCFVLMSNTIYQCSYRSREDEGVFCAHVQQFSLIYIKPHRRSQYTIHSQDLQLRLDIMNT